MTTAPTHVPRRHTSSRLYLALLASLVLLTATAVVLLALNLWRDDSTSSAGLHGSGIAATQLRTVPSFTAIDLAGGNNVTVQVGAKQAVVVGADDNLIDRVTTDVQRGTLVLGTKGSFSTERPMTVDVTVPTLETVVLSGSGVVIVEGLESRAICRERARQRPSHHQRHGRTPGCQPCRLGRCSTPGPRRPRGHGDALGIRATPGSRNRLARRVRAWHRRDPVRRRPGERHPERHGYRSHHEVVAHPIRHLACETSEKEEQ